MRKLLLLVIIACLGLTACGDRSSGAVQAVDGYYRALVDRDENRLITYTCAEWEDMALLEYDSFQGVAVELDGPSCQQAGQDGDMTLVECSGKIVATYNNEKQDFSLSGRVHRMVQEGGDWRVCGY
jgi:hypothetical protein